MPYLHSYQQFTIELACRVEKHRRRPPSHPKSRLSLEAEPWLALQFPRLWAQPRAAHRILNKKIEVVQAEEK